MDFQTLHVGQICVRKHSLIETKICENINGDLVMCAVPGYLFSNYECFLQRLWFQSEYRTGNECSPFRLNVKWFHEFYNHSTRMGHLSGKNVLLKTNLLQEIQHFPEIQWIGAFRIERDLRYYLLKNWTSTMLDFLNDLLFQLRPNILWPLSREQRTINWKWNEFEITLKKPQWANMFQYRHMFEC